MNESINTELLSDNIGLNNSYKKEIVEVLKNIPIININQAPFSLSQIKRLASQSPQLIFITAELINYEQMQSCKGLIRRIRKKIPQTKIVLFSNFITKADKQLVLESGLDNWVDVKNIRAELPKIIEELRTNESTGQNQ